MEECLPNMHKALDLILSTAKQTKAHMHLSSFLGLGSRTKNLGKENYINTVPCREMSKAPRRKGTISSSTLHPVLFLGYTVAQVVWPL